MVAPLIHDGAQCFVCLQYFHFFSQFCDKNKIEIIFTSFSVGVVLFGYCCGERKLFIDSSLSEPEWLPIAFDAVGLPTPIKGADKQMHFGVFMSLN